MTTWWRGELRTLDITTVSKYAQFRLRFMCTFVNALDLRVPIALDLELLVAFIKSFITHWVSTSGLKVPQGRTLATHALIAEVMSEQYRLQWESAETWSSVNGNASIVVEKHSLPNRLDNCELISNRLAFMRNYTRGHLFFWSISLVFPFHFFCVLLMDLRHPTMKLLPQSFTHLKQTWTELKSPAKLHLWSPNHASDRELW